MAGSHVVLFLDTNIFLHYLPFEQIDWLKVVGAGSVLIVIPPVIVRELNKHKDFHPQPYIRSRVAKVIQRLFALLENGAHVHVCNRVGIYLEPHDPSVDFGDYRLNKDSQDDHLIASILTYRQAHSSEDIRLVTSDSGLHLVAKAKKWGITPLSLSDDWKLPVEQDADKKRIQELERQIRSYEARIPKLQILFADGRQLKRIVLESPEILTEADIEVALDDVKYEHPKWDVPQTSDKEDALETVAEAKAKILSVSEILEAAARDITPTRREIELYNESLEKFYEHYVQFMLLDLEFRNTMRRMARIDIGIANEGKVPAEGIDIRLHFPDGFDLLTEDELPTQPEPPVPPETLKSSLQRTVENVVLSSRLPFLQPDLQIFRPTLSDIGGFFTNVSSPSIRRVNSYEVDVHVQKVKHNLQEELDPLYLVFDSFESAKSFGIECKILADNVPEAVSGLLHVVIEKHE
jgi:hypothetical protein